MEVLGPQGAPVLEEPAALHQGWDVLSELFVALVLLQVSTALVLPSLAGAPSPTSRAYFRTRLPWVLLKSDRD